MKYPAILLLMTLLSQPAAALNSDFDQPIQIQADSSLLNQGQGIDIYSGRVELSQGSLSLTADELRIHKNSNGNLDRIVAIGEPVYLQQLNEQQQTITATAAKIVFQSVKGVIELSDDAQLIHPGNAIVNAQQITYDSRTHQVRSSGGKDPGKRATIILQPQSSQLNLAPSNNSDTSTTPEPNNAEPLNQDESSNAGS